jgi:hypothetical protein
MDNDSRRIKGDPHTNPLRTTLCRNRITSISGTLPNNIAFKYTWLSVEKERPVHESDAKRLQNEIDAIKRQIEEQQTIIRECQVYSHGMLLLEAVDNLRTLKRRLDKLETRSHAGVNPPAHPR